MSEYLDGGRIVIATQDGEVFNNIKRGDLLIHTKNDANMIHFGVGSNGNKSTLMTLCNDKLHIFADVHTSGSITAAGGGVNFVLSQSLMDGASNVPSSALAMSNMYSTVNNFLSPIFVSNATNEVLPPNANADVFTTSDGNYTFSASSTDISYSPYLAFDGSGSTQWSCSELYNLTTGEYQGSVNTKCSDGSVVNGEYLQIQMPLSKFVDSCDVTLNGALRVMVLGSMSGSDGTWVVVNDSAQSDLVGSGVQSYNLKCDKNPLRVEYSYYRIAMTKSQIGVGAFTVVEWKLNAYSKNIRNVDTIYAKSAIGVGSTTTPSAPLDVTGNAIIRGSITASSLNVYTLCNTINAVTTEVKVTDQFSISNVGTGPALTVRQQGAQAIAEFYDDTNLALKIHDLGLVSIGNSSSATATLDVYGIAKFNSNVTITGSVSAGSYCNLIQTYNNPSQSNPVSSYAVSNLYSWVVSQNYSTGSSGSGSLGGYTNSFSNIPTTSNIVPYFGSSNTLVNATGTYVASCSSTYGASAQYQAWNAFDSVKYSSGYYIYTRANSYSGGNAVYTYPGCPIAGEYVQIQLPNAVAVESFDLIPGGAAQFDSVWCSFTDFSLYGSNDGTTFTLVCSFTGQVWTNTNVKNFKTNNSTPYKYFRLIISKCTYQAAMIADWTLYQQLPVYYMYAGVTSTCSNLYINNSNNIYSGAALDVNGDTILRGALTTSSTLTTTSLVASSSISCSNIVNAASLAMPCMTLSNNWITHPPRVVAGSVVNNNVITSAFGAYIVSSSSSNVGGGIWEAYGAFDGYKTISTSNAWLSAPGSYTTAGAPYNTYSGTGNGEYLQVQMPLPAYIQAFDITALQNHVASNPPNFSPGTFTLYGSSNGTTFTPIYQQSTPLTWYGLETKVFSLSNYNTPYNFYRLVFNTTANQGGTRTAVGISEMNLYGSFANVTANINNMYLQPMTSNLGIGKLPTYTLDVAGSMQASNSYYLNGVTLATDYGQGTAVIISASNNFPDPTSANVINNYVVTMSNSSMTATNGYYIFSASSEENSYNTPNYKAFRAFDNSASTFWTSQNGTYWVMGAPYKYNGNILTKVSGSNVAGEFIQIQLPTAIRLNSYVLTCPAGWNTPNSWTVAGSIDNGVTWTTVDVKSGRNPEGTSLNLTVSPTVQVAYNIYRLIVTMHNYPNNTKSQVSITQWTLNGDVIIPQRLTNAWYVPYSTSNLVYNPGGTNYIGIGLSNPSTKLDVLGNTTVRGNVACSNVNATTYSNLPQATTSVAGIVMLSDDYTLSSSTIAPTSTALSNTWFTLSNVAFSASNQAFSGSSSSGGGSSQWTTNDSFIYIMGSNVSIGSNVNAAPLDVTGDAVIRGNITTSNAALDGSFTAATYCNLIQNFDTNGSNNIPPSAAALSNAYFTLSNALQTAGGATAGSTYWVNGTGNTYTMSNVGINTSTPNASYKLDVNGALNATTLYQNGTVVKSTPWNTTANGIYYNSANVGIGVSDPMDRILSVSGTRIRFETSYIFCDPYNGTPPVIKLYGNVANGGSPRIVMASSAGPTFSIGYYNNNNTSVPYTYIAGQGGPETGNPTLTQDDIRFFPTTTTFTRKVYINYTTNTSDPSTQYDFYVNGSAYTTVSWTGSDARIKTNIELADLDICYNNVKALPLKRYEWTVDLDKHVDAREIGWIAQDMEQVFPKAVLSNNMYGYEDFKTINKDQVYAMMYGALQKTINIVEQQEARIQTLEADKTSLESRLAALEAKAV